MNLCFDLLDDLWYSKSEMERNFFIRLAFAAHRVADALQDAEQIKMEIKNAADNVLAGLVLLSDKDNVPKDKKKFLIPKILKDIESLNTSLQMAKQEGRVNPENFSVLEAEDGKIQYMLQIFEEVEEPAEETRRAAPVPKAKEEVSLPVAREVIPKQEQRGITERQRSIIELLKTKKKVQVWELQKVLPQVTKRTLRRDLDDLLSMNLIERKGEWNAVSYELKERAVP